MLLPRISSSCLLKGLACWLVVSTVITFTLWQDISPNVSRYLSTVVRRLDTSTPSYPPQTPHRSPGKNIGEEFGDYEWLSENFNRSIAMPKQLRALADLFYLGQFAAIAWATSLGVATKEQRNKRFPCVLKVDGQRCMVFKPENVSLFCRKMNVSSQALALASTMLLHRHQQTRLEMLTGASSSKVFLLVLTKSAPRNEAKRRNTRGAWLAHAQDRSCEPLSMSNRTCVISGWGLKENGFVWLHSFVVGLQFSMERLLSELEMHQDIVVYPDIDVYDRLTWKVVWAMNWSLRNYNYEYLLLLDDDVFVRYDLLADFLHSGEEFEYAGQVTRNKAAVMRDPDKRWFVPWGVYNSSVYPLYVFGAAVFLSHVAAEKCVSEAGETPISSWFGIDDAFIAILLLRQGIEPKNIPSVFVDKSHPLLLPYSDCDADKARLKFFMILITTCDSGRATLDFQGVWRKMWQRQRW